MTYLLDTNACIDFIRDVGQTRRRMKSKPFSEFCLSSIVVAELMHGAKRSPNVDKHVPATQNFCKKFKIVDFDESAAATFGDVRLQLEREGLPIGAYDMLIAAQAKSLNLICVTNDQGFRRVNGLAVEDWR
ncbi:MAG: PIN domain-containing protein [Opitutales bacterium]